MNFGNGLVQSGYNPIFEGAIKQQANIWTIVNYVL